jgi:hypothetical protein
VAPPRPHLWTAVSRNQQVVLRVERRQISPSSPYPLSLTDDRARQGNGAAGRSFSRFEQRIRPKPRYYLEAETLIADKSLTLRHRELKPGSATMPAVPAGNNAK